MAVKMDSGSLILGIAIGVGAFMLYDYLFWADGGLLQAEPTEVF